MFTLHIESKVEEAPQAVYPCDDFDSSDPKFTSKVLEGRWARVMPRTAKDVLYLQMLEHHRDKFAPYDGDGILVRAECLSLRILPFAP